MDSGGEDEVMACWVLGSVAGNAEGCNQQLPIMYVCQPLNCLMAQAAGMHDKSYILHL
jgi:hypothetical protein